MKALDCNGDSFYHIYSIFPSLRKRKKKLGVFGGSQIRTFFRGATFVTTMNRIKASDWNAFCDVTKNFLGSRKADNYKEIVEETFPSFLLLRSKIKLYYLQSYLSNFP